MADPPPERRAGRRRAARVLAPLASCLLALGLAEVAVRVKHRNGRNYDIEMWRYARLLKQRSEDPQLGHEHVAGASATLQSVEVRLDERGLRGAPAGPVVPGRRRLLFLGSSITLGWGVAEADTLSERVRRLFASDGQEVDVLNAGIGNYNAPRYVRRYLTRLADLRPTDIVVHAFLRDAEPLPQESGNALLRTSQLAVLGWSALHRAVDRRGPEALVEHYRALYAADAPSFLAMKAAFEELAAHARAAGIRVTVAMTPDFSTLRSYPFTAIHERVGALSRACGFEFVDLYPAVAGLDPQQAWVMPGDPHPNAKMHELMAQALYPALRRAPPGGG